MPKELLERKYCLKSCNITRELLRLLLIMVPILSEFKSVKQQQYPEVLTLTINIIRDYYKWPLLHTFKHKLRHQK
jgi:hypothetical protein